MDDIQSNLIIFIFYCRSPIPVEETCSSISPSPSLDQAKNPPKSGEENPPIDKESAGDSVHLKNTADDSVHNLKSADLSVDKHLISDTEQKIDAILDSVTPVEENLSLKTVRCLIICF